MDVVSFYHQPREGEDDDTRLVIRQLCDNSWNALPAASESNLLKFCYWITHLATHSVKIPVTSRRAMHQRYFDLFNNHGLRRILCILQNAFSDACLLELQTREAMNALLQTSTTLQSNIIPEEHVYSNEKSQHRQETYSRLMTCALFLRQ